MRVSRTSSWSIPRLMWKAYSASVDQPMMITKSPRMRLMPCRSSLSASQSPAPKHKNDRVVLTFIDWSVGRMYVREGTLKTQPQKATSPKIETRNASAFDACRNRGARRRTSITLRSDWSLGEYTEILTVADYKTVPLPCEKRNVAAFYRKCWAVQRGNWLSTMAGSGFLPR